MHTKSAFLNFRFHWHSTPIGFSGLQGRRGIFYTKKHPEMEVTLSSLSMSKCFLLRSFDLDLIFQELPYHLDFNLSASERAEYGEAGTNLLSNYPRIQPTNQPNHPDFDFEPAACLNSL